MSNKLFSSIRKEMYDTNCQDEWGKILSKLENDRRIVKMAVFDKLFPVLGKNTINT